MAELDAAALWTAVVLCNDAVAGVEGWLGDPTETALLEAAQALAQRGLRDAQIDRGLRKAADPCHHLGWLGSAGGGEHVGGVVGGEDHPVRLLTQHWPEAAGAAGQV